MALIALPSVGWASSLATVFFGIAAATYAFLWALLHLTQDSREPPLAPCVIPIPFIGPVIEMRRKRSKFPIYMKYVEELNTLETRSGLLIMCTNGVGC